MIIRSISKLKQISTQYPSPTIAVSLAVLCLFLGLSTGFWLLFRLFYIIAIAIPLLYLWTRSMIKSLDVEISRETQRAAQGQSIRGFITLRSKSILPKIWLELSDQSTIPAHTSNRTITLPSKGTTIWSYNTEALLRGLYTLGPLTVTATDPFGFFKFSRTFGSESSVLIYPHTPELTYFHTPSSNLPGEGHFRKRSHNITPNIFGLRDYIPGDAFNRIHWPSTAKKNRVIVKDFEIDPSSEIWLLLDFNKTHHTGINLNSTAEISAQICAGLARYFIQSNRSVGLAFFDDSMKVDKPEKGNSHFTRILESLALAKAIGPVAIENLILEQSSKFGRHSTVIAITPSTNTQWVTELKSLHNRGVQVTAITLTANSFGEAISSNNVHKSLEQNGLPYYEITSDTKLNDALSTKISRKSKPIIGDQL
ncbi:MAG: hypothetical protein CL792_04470 [Chloroflexi bacterium]|nr:hypothetical protein [Chloroflexota bacterium]